MSASCAGYAAETQTVKRYGSADDVPEQLPQQIREVIDDKATLSEILTSHSKLAFRTADAERAWEYHLSRTSEELEIKMYNLAIWLRTHIRHPRRNNKVYVTVASGPSFVSPVIIARKGDWNSGILSVWRGRQGFDEKCLIRKTYEVGEAVPDVARSKTHDAGAAERPRASRARPLTPQTLARTSRVDDIRSPGALEVDRDEDDMIIVESPVLQDPEHSRCIKLEPIQEAHIVAKSTYFLFIVVDDLVVRKRPFSQCDTVGKLFSQATAARILRSGSDRHTLSVKLSEADDDEELFVFRDDQEDFANLLTAIKGHSCWKLNGEGAACEVKIGLCRD